jgi:hypothetical protein
LKYGIIARRHILFPSFSMTGRIFELRTAADIADLKSLFDVGRRHELTQVKIVLPRQPPARVAAAEARINNALFACGCEIATVSAGFAVIAYGLWVFFRPHGVGSLDWWDAAGVTAAFVAAMLVGKFAGLRYAARSFDRELRALTDMISKDAELLAVD